MGATTFYTKSTAIASIGAFNKAVEEAESEFGHQQGYSGQINSKPSFTTFRVPVNVNFERWIDALREEELPGDMYEHHKEFDKQLKVYADKRAPACCYLVPKGHAWDKSDANSSTYIFMGYAPE